VVAQATDGIHEAVMFQFGGGLDHGKPFAAVTVELRQSRSRRWHNASGLAPVL